MNGPTLLLDANYLAHRAWHALGDLRHGTGGTAAIFGTLRDAVLLSHEFKAQRLVWCFDYGGKSHRAAQLPGYKAGRAARHAQATAEEKAQREDFQRQLRQLRRQVLRGVGFRNVFAKRGYEADDIIAAAAAATPPGEEAYIIASDQDLWQCLRPNVHCYNPQTKQLQTADTFRAKYGIDPIQWADVKAFAGCSTDDVPGLPGIGPATAAKWVRGVLGSHTKAYATISNGLATYNQNIGIVRLPYPGCPTPRLRPDVVREEWWVEVLGVMGIKSLAGSLPYGAQRKSRGRKRGRRG